MIMIRLYALGRALDTLAFGVCAGAQPPEASRDDRLDEVHTRVVEGKLAQAMPVAKKSKEKKPKKERKEDDDDDWSGAADPMLLPIILACCARLSSG